MKTLTQVKDNSLSLDDLNLTPENWKIMARELCKKYEERYDDSAAEEELHYLKCFSCDFGEPGLNALTQIVLANPNLKELTLLWCTSLPTDPFLKLTTAIGESSTMQAFRFCYIQLEPSAWLGYAMALRSSTTLGHIVDMHASNVGPAECQAIAKAIRGRERIRILNLPSSISERRIYCRY